MSLLNTLAQRLRYVRVAIEDREIRGALSLVIENLGVRPTSQKNLDSTSLPAPCGCMECGHPAHRSRVDACPILQERPQQADVPRTCGFDHELAAVRRAGHPDREGSQPEAVGHEDRPPRPTVARQDSQWEAMQATSDRPRSRDGNHKPYKRHDNANHRHGRPQEADRAPMRVRQGKTNRLRPSIPTENSLLPHKPGRKCPQHRLTDHREHRHAPRERRPRLRRQLVRTGRTPNLRVMLLSPVIAGNVHGLR